MTAICQECGLPIAECNERALDRIEAERSARLEIQRKRVVELEAALRAIINRANDPMCFGPALDDIVDIARKALKID